MRMLGLAVGFLAVLCVAASVEGGISTTDFGAAGFIVGDSVDNYLADGTQAVPMIDYTNWSPPAWAAIGSRRAGFTADEEIVDLGGEHGKVWRFSPGGEDGVLGQTPKSPHAGFVAGESGALNDAGMGAVTSNRFYGQVDFRSVVTSGEQGMSVRICAASADQRHGYVRIQDSGLGLDLDLWDATVGDYSSIATGLSYTDWHTLGIDILFNDGAANDVVTIYVDGGSVLTGPSWEAYYTAHAESVDRLSFDASPINDDFLGGGLYFDNVIVSDTAPTGNAIPEPSTVIIWSLLGTLAITVSWWRRNGR